MMRWVKPVLRKNSSCLRQCVGRSRVGSKAVKLPDGPTGNAGGLPEVVSSPIMIGADGGLQRIYNSFHRSLRKAGVKRQRQG
jgi:hypothetical protein